MRASFSGGQYAFGGLAAGRYRVKISRRRPRDAAVLRRELVDDATTITLAVGQARTANIALLKGVTVSGVVRRAGTPLAVSRSTSRATTDPSGWSGRT